MAVELKVALENWHLTFNIFFFFLLDANIVAPNNHVFFP